MATEPTALVTAFFELPETGIMTGFSSIGYLGKEN
jgi:hypothetical protein